MSAVLPDEIAAKVKDGHTLEPDHPVLSRVARWTCTVCGDAVLANDVMVYGGVTERTCAESKEFWGSTS